MLEDDSIDISNHKEKCFVETKLECPVFKPPQIASPTRLVIPRPPAVNLIPTVSKWPSVRLATSTAARPTGNSYVSSPPLAASSPLNATCLAANTLTHAPMSLSRLSVGDIKTDIDAAYSHKKFGKNKFGVLSYDDTSSLSPVASTALPSAPTTSPQSVWEQARLPSCDQPVDLKPGQQHEQPRHEIPCSSIPYSTSVCRTVRPVRPGSVIMVPVCKIKY